MTGFAAELSNFFVADSLAGAFGILFPNVGASLEVGLSDFFGVGSLNAAVRKLFPIVGADLVVELVDLFADASLDGMGGTDSSSAAGVGAFSKSDGSDGARSFGNVGIRVSASPTLQGT